MAFSRIDCVFCMDGIVYDTVRNVPLRYLASMFRLDQISFEKGGDY